MLRALALPIPERERTLRVIVPKGTVPAWGHKCLCAIPAVQAWRTALENSCTKVRVEDGTGHVHDFDAMDLLKHVVTKHLGFFPTVMKVNGKTPAGLATAGQRALGNTLEEAKSVFAVSGGMPAA
jgi:hypothetical protein